MNPSFFLLHSRNQKPFEKGNRMKFKAVPYTRVLLIALAFICCCPLSRAGIAAEPGDDLSTKIASVPVFYENLALIGKARPASDENQELWAAIQKMKSDGPGVGVPDLDRFITAHVNSPWLPSLQANLGRYH